MISDKQHTLDLIIGETDGFTSSNDVFKYKEFGNKFVNFFKNETNPSVVMLTGEWGSGKTIFRRQLAGECRKSDMDVLEFDAFESDYINDAFLAISSDLLTVDDTYKKQKDIFIGLGRLLSSTADYIPSMPAGGKKVLDAGIDKVEGIMNNRAEYKKTVIGFRETLAKIAEQKTLVIMVDELDRCRPDFALSVLEVIKHFFNIPNIHFMIITNETQLFSSIIHCYGGEEDQAEQYLEKFYDIRAELPFDKERKQKQAWQYIINFLNKYDVKCDREVVAVRLSTLITEEKRNLRKFNKDLRIASVILESCGTWRNANYISFFAGLVMLRLLDLDVFYELYADPTNKYIQNKVKDLLVTNNMFSLTFSTPYVNAVKEMYETIEENNPL